eukprot:12746049-Prorocentrum_lima.AAC.1
MVAHGLELILLDQQTHARSSLFKDPEDMEPANQQWMCLRDPESKPMWMRADGATRNTSP